MKPTYLKSFLMLALAVPMLTFADDFADDTEATILPVEPTTETTILPVEPTNEQVGMRKPKITPPDNEDKKEGQSKWAAEYPPVYFSSGTHGIAAISALGDSLEIEDGSVWKISAYDAYKVANWFSTDVIQITQNHRWFSKYKYRIINHTTGAALEANLFLGPLKDGLHTRYVFAIDPIRGELILNDDTRWRVSFYDVNDFQNWELYDAVIIGYNSGYDSDCHGLLINVNMNQSIRAEQF